MGSRFTHPAESRYAPIKGEALAVADALDKARHFVLGCRNLTIAVDHRPLLKIFGDRSLDHSCNTRLRNLKEKTLRYHFKMVHIPGVKNRAPDTLSRHPTGDHHPPKMVLHDDIHSIQESTAIPPTHIPIQLKLEYAQMTSYTLFKWKTNYRSHSYPPYTPHILSVGNKS